MEVSVIVFAVLAALFTSAALWVIAAISSFQQAKRNYVGRPPDPPSQSLVRDPAAADRALRGIDWNFPSHPPRRLEVRKLPANPGDDPVGRRVEVDSPEAIAATAGAAAQDSGDDEAPVPRLAHQ